MYVEEKAWGYDLTLFMNQLVSVHRLSIKKGGVCSWHKHSSVWNRFYLLDGKVQILYGDIDQQYTHMLDQLGSWIDIEPETYHQFIALEDSSAIEIVFTHLNSDDIERVTKSFLDSTIDQLVNKPL